MREKYPREVYYPTDDEVMTPEEQEEFVEQKQYEAARDKVQRHADPSTPRSVITERIEERLNDDKVGR